MTTRRLFAAATVAALATASLTGCSLLSSVLPGGGSAPVAPGSSNPLTGTSWSGVDSDGDAWGFEFQDDGTVGLTYNGSSYDDASDTWTLSGSTLDIHTAFDDGDVDLTGDVGSGGAPIDLDGRYSGGDFTLTITQD
ncbi:MAG: hypothetical protein J0G30_09905 [Actinomycetales bacterium]|nr:hypothetical protein [Actinomycetales bacterium]